MLAAQSRRNLLGVRIACQQTQILLRPRQPVAPTARSPMTGMQGQRQINTRADRHFMALKQLVKRRKFVEIGLDVRCRLLVPKRIERVKIFAVMRTNQRKKLIKNRPWQRRYLAAVQRHIEWQHAGRTQRLKRVTQGIHGTRGIHPQSRLRRLRAEIAIITIEVATQRRHVKQMNAPRSGRIGPGRNSLIHKRSSRSLQN